MGNEKDEHLAICNEHGIICVISSDFGDRMTTQSMGLMVVLSELLDPRDGAKMPYKTKHEERTQKTLNWTSSAEISITERTDALASVHPMVVGRSDALLWCKSVRLWRSSE